MSNSTLSTLDPEQPEQRSFRRQFFLAAAITSVGANLVYALMLEVVVDAVANGVVCLFVLAAAVAFSRALLQGYLVPAGAVHAYARLGALALALFATSAVFSGMLFLGVGAVAIAFEST